MTGSTGETWRIAQSYNSCTSTVRGNRQYLPADMVRLAPATAAHLCILHQPRHVACEPIRIRNRTGPQGGMRQ